MKFLFRSHDGLCLSQALRVKSEGNQVKLSIEEPKYDDAGNGLISKVLNFQSAVDWADVIIYDPKGPKLPVEAEKIRKSKPVLGCSEFSGKMENDRKFGIDLAKKIGIKIPEVSEFTGPAAFRQVRDFLVKKDSKTDWVWKVNGKAPEGIGTYVAKGGRPEISRMLVYFEDRYRQEKITPNFILTSKIEGTEISTEGWWNGHNWFFPNHTIERNKFFPGDLGEKVGCCGNVVWKLDLDSPLFRKLFDNLGQELGNKYLGPVDINAIIEKSTNEPIFLEFSPRFGYDAIFAAMELFESDFGEFLYGLANSQTIQCNLREQFAGDVRLTIPPFPAKADESEAIGIPIFGYNETPYNPHHHPVEVKLDQDDKPVTSGPTGYVMSVTALGNSASNAQENAYKLIEKLRVPNGRYRNDLANAIQEVYDDLEETGWLTTGKPAGPIGLKLGLDLGNFRSRLRRF